MGTFNAAAPERAAIVASAAAALASDERVTFAYVHGSFLLETPFHDVDIAVEFAPSVVWPDEQALRLGEELSARLRLPVDVRALNTAPVGFRFHALKGRLLAARDEDRLYAMLEDTMRRYFDLAPVLLRATREAFAA